MELRYLGFDQKKSTRTYRFKGVANGEPTLYFLVTADLALFLTHKIGIQEGPGLCMRKLTSDFLLEPPLGDHQLTNDDLLGYTSDRAMADARKAALRGAGRRRLPVPVEPVSTAPILSTQHNIG